MNVIEFAGPRHEVEEAEAWCRRRTCEGYAVRREKCGLYYFTFICPFEAQSFRDAYREETTPIYD